MDHFSYRNGELYAEDVPLRTIAAEVGTPVYVYSAATLRRHARVMQQALAPLSAPLVAFAVKANSNLAVLKLLGQEGLGADVVSVGELRRALAAGIPAGRILFSGVGKRDDEIRFALAAGIHQLNVESRSELVKIGALAAAMGKVADVVFRVNPDVDAHTHAKISTGKAENKFGVPFSRVAELYALAEATPSLRPVGIAAHIGSQITELEPMRRAFEKMGELVQSLRRAGHEVRRVDFGGGLGVPYDAAEPAPPSPEAYGAMVRDVVARWPAADALQLQFEPGRLIAGNAGVLLARVVTLKEGTTRRFVVLDAAMNDLLRPALYGAWHAIRAVAPRPGEVRATVVGPVCETGDQFAEGRAITPVVEGDLVALMTAGAYGAVMAGTYNTRPLVPEVLVDGDRYAVIRPRLSVEEMLARDHVPIWL